MKFIDANIVLRYLLDDHHDLSPKAREIIDKEPQLFINDGVFAEIVYVLNKTYQVEKQMINEVLTQLVSKGNIFVSSIEVIKTALQFFETQNIDFIDCLLCGYNRIEKVNIISFDKRLNKLLN